MAANATEINFLLALVIQIFLFEEIKDGINQIRVGDRRRILVEIRKISHGQRSLGGGFCDRS